MKMGSSENNAPAKPSKAASSAQEAPTTPSYPDWSNMQAYYGAAATPPFFANPAASPTPHPYMWGSQHAMMPPYGTPVPYPAYYHPGGMYAHPTMATVVNAGHANGEMEGKTPDGKDRSSSKKTKGALGLGGKSGEIGKATSGSGNDGVTQSVESGSEDSSEESDENNNQQDYATPTNKKGSFNQMLADGANSQNLANGANQQVPGNPVGPVSAANINMGMDLWSASAAGSGAVKMRQNSHAGGMMGEQWMDERELKRQKRKQSNRESARRSRLRKQAECEELQVKVDTLSNENRTLREEMQRLSEECEKLTSENNSIKEDLTRLCGPEAVSKLENINTNQQRLQSRGNDGNN